MMKELLNKIVKLNVKAMLFTVVLLGNSTSLFAQVYNNGILNAGYGGSFYVKTGPFTVGANSTIDTSKNAPYDAYDGKILLGPSVNFITDGTGTKFVDGFVGTYSTTETVLPIASSGVYAPIKVTAASNVSGVRAAFFAESPTPYFSAGLSSSVANRIDSEFYIVNGDNSVLSLSWRSSSNLSSFTSSLVGLTIVGLNTTTNKWDAIDSNPESGSTLSSGFIKSTSPINLANYKAFTIGEKTISCFSAVTASGNTRTWNGTSWDVAPTLADAAVLNGPYTGTGFQCNSLNLNTYNATLSSGTLEIVNGVSGTGKIILNGTGSLIQQSSSGTKPQIELTRTTRPMKRFDYVYWGSPVVENVFSQLSTNAIAAGQSTPGAFDDKYSYVSGLTNASGGWQPLTATESGKGFIMRVKQQAPFVDATTTATIDLKFAGTANNGDISVPVTRVIGNDTSARNNNLLANPYPSAIDVDKFLTLNNNLIDGVVYLWRSNTSNTGAAGATYTNSDYIAYTKAGSTSANVGNAVVFNGKIASGQGFKVRALAGGNVLFTNCMRVTDTNSNGQFMRNNAYDASVNEEQKDRFKLNLQTSEGIVNQILIAYLPGTTLGYDNMYDARLFTVGNTNIFSILDNSTVKLAINARPSFANTDQVAIGFTKDATVTTPMRIDIADKEGVFANNQTPVYLYDSQLGMYHNFANGAYTFNASDNESTSRFKIVYQTSALDNDTFDNLTVNAFMTNNKIIVESNNEIDYVQIYDLTGRLIQTINANNQKSVQNDFINAKSIYIVKIYSSNGSITSKKLINN